MKKAMILILTALTMVLSLVSCGNETTSKDGMGTTTQMVEAEIPEAIVSMIHNVNKYGEPVINGDVFWSELEDGNYYFIWNYRFVGMEKSHSEEEERVIDSSGQTIDFAAEDDPDFPNTRLTVVHKIEAAMEGGKTKEEIKKNLQEGDYPVIWKTETEFVNELRKMGVSGVYAWREYSLSTKVESHALDAAWRVAVDYENQSGKEAKIHHTVIVMQDGDNYITCLCASKDDDLLLDMQERINVVETYDGELVEKINDCDSAFVDYIANYESMSMAEQEEFRNRPGVWVYSAAEFVKAANAAGYDNIN